MFQKVKHRFKVVKLLTTRNVMLRLDRVCWLSEPDRIRKRFQRVLKIQTPTQQPLVEVKQANRQNVLLLFGFRGLEIFQGSRRLTPKQALQVRNLQLK